MADQYDSPTMNNFFAFFSTAKQQLAFSSIMSRLVSDVCSVGYYCENWLSYW